MYISHCLYRSRSLPVALAESESMSGERGGTNQGHKNKGKPLRFFQCLLLLSLYLTVRVPLCHCLYLWLPVALAESESMRGEGGGTNKGTAGKLMSG